MSFPNRQPRRTVNQPPPGGKYGAPEGVIATHLGTDGKAIEGHYGQDMIVGGTYDAQGNYAGGGKKVLAGTSWAPEAEQDPLPPGPQQSGRAEQIRARDPAKYWNAMTPMEKSVQAPILENQKAGARADWSERVSAFKQTQSDLGKRGELASQRFAKINDGINARVADNLSGRATVDKAAANSRLPENSGSVSWAQTPYGKVGVREVGLTPDGKTAQVPVKPATLPEPRPASAFSYSGAPKGGAGVNAVPVPTAAELSPSGTAPEAPANAFSGAPPSVPKFAPSDGPDIVQNRPFQPSDPNLVMAGDNAPQAKQLETNTAKIPFNPGDEQAKSQFEGLSKWPTAPTQQRADDNLKSDPIIGGIGKAIKWAGSAAESVGQTAKNLVTGQTAWQRGGLVSGSSKPAAPQMQEPTPEQDAAEEEKKRRNAFSGAPAYAGL